MTAMCQTFLTGRIKKGIRQIFPYFLATGFMLHQHFEYEQSCESLQTNFQTKPSNLPQAVHIDK